MPNIIFNILLNYQAGSQFNMYHVLKVLKVKVLKLLSNYTVSPFVLI